ncbi:unnamed protein product [Candidula unifasciata]|uniref:Vitellogenin receptor n=1 Tax=Candidula unifasciata TaxID=100452 RepID=A0A8S4A0E4_9EUPU|nr:unnamed protein product [Candidula unifasciata]
MKMSVRFVVMVFVAFIVAASATKKQTRKLASPNSRASIVKRQVTCKGNQFMCQDGMCIQDEWVCDMERDCYDSSDEDGCPTDCSGEHQVKCNNGKCVSAEYRCDGEDDCGDNTDELNCKTKDCSPGEVHCDNFVCIEDTWFCDKIDDCGDGFDERNCTGSCASHQFRCADGSRCIDRRFECDGEDDCRDASDELQCVCDEATEWKCKNGRCINQEWRCDRDNDCGDASDELNCPEEHDSLCHDMLNLRDCALMNETAHPICINQVDGHKYCRKYCGMCITSVDAP